MEIKKSHWIGIFAALVLIASSFFFKEAGLFAFVIGIGIIVGVVPFVLSTIAEAKKATEKEEIFLEFARNLVESVKMGSSVSRAIILLKDKRYGVLSEHVKKLGNQIEIGIRLSDALQNFARDIKNKKISRAINLIRQAERAGGNIGEILESVAEAVSITDKLKKERKAKISALMVQGYIIFFVFIIIVLVLQFNILPMVSGIAGLTTIEGETPLHGVNESAIANAFLYLLLTQGFFSGLIIGKLAEGSIKYGIKHSFILMISAFLASIGSNAFF